MARPHRRSHRSRRRPRGPGLQGRAPDTAPSRRDRRPVRRVSLAGAGQGPRPLIAQCLRTVPATTAFQVAGAGYQLGGQGTIAPTLNGSTLVAKLRDELQDSAINRVPVIDGLSRDEALTGAATTPASLDAADPAPVVRQVGAGGATAVPAVAIRLAVGGLQDGRCRLQRGVPGPHRRPRNSLGGCRCTAVR